MSGFDRTVVAGSIERGRMVQQVSEVAQLLRVALEDHEGEAQRAGEEGREYAGGLHRGWVEGLRHAAGSLDDLVAEWRSR